ncbi:MAG: NADH:ubiquinone reductase (Na(+)-transporting) subunit B [Flavobacteriales bacterium]|jgi:Na+-transporting NADH:ubiquinone oxidoreductase subunit B|nr:NADH:ubiquinone reductase (Na(+)-transporting) subunit B [Flavobacteriales bacterium]
MKFIRKQLDSVKPNFEKGGKWEKFMPAFEGIETLLYVPDHVTHKGSHIRDGIDLKRTMVTVIFAMIPALLFGMYNVGLQHHAALGTEASLMENFMFGLWKVLPLLIVSYGVGLFIEFAFAIQRGHSVNEGYLVSGMLIPLIVPVDVPLWMLAVAVVFAVVIGKEVFGGTGMNIVNPALTARAFLFFAYPTKMSGDKIWVAGGDNPAAYGVDAISGETLLGTLANNGSIESTSIADMFFGFIPGSVGETSALAIILGAMLLIYTGIGSWKIMLSSLIGGTLMIALMNAVGNEDNALMMTGVLEHLLIGGFLFGIVFMATDPVTASQTETGKWIYGFLVGLLAMLIRVLNPAYPEGMMMAILFMNIMAPLIDHYVVQSNVTKRLKRVKA